jgi:hypothetical protein
LPQLKSSTANLYVTPPNQVLTTLFQQAGKETSPISVKGKLNSADFRQSLVRYMGWWCLYINGKMADLARLQYQSSIGAIVGKNLLLRLYFTLNQLLSQCFLNLKKLLQMT